MANPVKEFSVAVIATEQDAYTNRFYLNPEDYKQFLQDPTQPSSRLNTTYVTIVGENPLDKNIISIQSSPGIKVGEIGVAKLQRTWLQLGLKQKVKLQIYDPEPLALSSITFKIDYFSEGKKGPKQDAKQFISQIGQDFDSQYLAVGQLIMLNCNSNNFKLYVDNVTLSSEGSKSSHRGISLCGLLLSTTQIILKKADNASIDIDTNGPMETNQIFKSDWDFENMGIGGLDVQFRDIFRRAFASRIFPPAIVAKLGVQHVKGILLHGPPGTGKTLIARQIGKMLNGREPKVVSGPEVLGRYVGQPEENIRNLFKDAEIEYKQKGDESGLHIIIFDEIDSICKTRGTKTGDAGVNDSIVNQLLAKIEGVNSLNNILVIGMTNRKDMIDEALLRPGRLEVHVEISLPDEAGRQQIFKIHTANMSKNNALSPDVDLAQLAHVTKNYSGAEIEGVVKAAASYAFSRQVDTKNIKNVKIREEDIVVCADDFRRGIKDIKPAFGQNDEQIRNYALNGIIEYGETFKKIQESGQNFINQVKNSSRTPLVSVLLSGRLGCGKSSFSTTLAQNSDFPYVRTISPDDLVGYTEAAKASKITKVFEDSYRSPLSCIVVDDLERLIEFVPIGPRFSNLILQTLLILFKRTPPKGCKLLVLATTSSQEAMKDLGLLGCFATSIPIPSITRREEFAQVLLELGVVGQKEQAIEIATYCFDDSQSIAIKQLIMAIEMARYEDGNLKENLKNSLQDYQLRDFTF